MIDHFLAKLGVVQYLFGPLHGLIGDVAVYFNYLKPLGLNIFNINCLRI
jgi:hypothetical protein